MNRSFRAACWIILWVSGPAAGQPPAAGSVAGTAPTVNLSSPEANSFVTGPRLEWKLPFNPQQRTFLFGPEVRVFTTHRFTLNAWASFGVAKRFALFTPLSQPVAAAAPIVQDHWAAPGQPRFGGTNGMAAFFGGSLNYRINDHLTYRIVQTEFLLIPNKTVVKKSAADSDVRVSTGMRFTFGK